MQQSGGLLLAAGLDGGNTLICSLGEQMQIESVLPHQKKTNPFGLVFFCVWAFGGRIRKAALSECPVDTRNRRGFSAEK